MAGRLFLFWRGPLTRTRIITTTPAGISSRAFSVVRVQNANIKSNIFNNGIINRYSILGSHGSSSCNKMCRYLGISSKRFCSSSSSSTKNIVKKGEKVKKSKPNKYVELVQKYGVMVIVFHTVVWTIALGGVWSRTVTKS